MLLHGPRGSDVRKTVRWRVSHSNQAPSTRRFSTDEWEPGSKETLEEILSSAVLAGDNELGHLVREVDKISDALKSDTPDTQSLSNALQVAAWYAVKQALRERELRSLALTDDLTGLYNRRGFLASATQHLKLARRNGLGLLLFFGDVDDLKKINDSYGHQEGDLALVRVADTLEQTFRDCDILASLGGDEFAVVTLDASGQDQEIILGRLEQNLKNSNEECFELSLSCGVARFDPTRPVQLGELMAQADQAMYERKLSQPRFAVKKP
jgi:diguanylate cyclase (GGDEF)-like protein